MGVDSGKSTPCYLGPDGKRQTDDPDHIKHARKTISPRTFGDPWADSVRTVCLSTTRRRIGRARGLLDVGGVLLGHGLHGHGAYEVHRLAEIGLEEQVHVGELVDGEARLDGDGDRVRGLGHVVTA